MHASARPSPVTSANWMVFQLLSLNEPFWRWSAPFCAIRTLPGAVGSYPAA
jgi:hypothetical protein